MTVHDTIADPSRLVALFGTSEPPETGEKIAFGGFAADIHTAAARNIFFRGREVLRAVAFVVRGQGWSTSRLKRDAIQICETDGELTLRIEGRTTETETRLEFLLQIRISSKGGFDLSAECTPEADFVTNRTGFVVLHPAINVAGGSVNLTHPDGTIKQTRFPALVAPAQPMEDIRALSYAVAPGMKATITMTGETFEMEDQRNWLDSTFKTYSRPISRPHPYLLPGGETFRQSVRIQVAADACPAASPSEEQVCRCSFGELEGVLPGFGTASTKGNLLQSEAVRETYGGLSLNHLLCDVDLEKDPGTAMSRHAGFAKLLAPGGTVTLETAVSGQDPESELVRLAALVRDAGLEPCRLSVFMREYLRAYQPTAPKPKTMTFEAFYATARRVFPGIPVGGGMYSHFTELNRTRAAASGADYVTHTTCPIVHDRDDQSVMQSLEALPAVFATTRDFAPGKPYRIGPSGISLRHNPGSGIVMANPKQVRKEHSGDDPRWRGLFGAAYLAGYAAEAAAAQLEAVTFGSIATETAFARDAGNGTVKLFPTYRVMAVLGAASHRPHLVSSSSQPTTLRVLAWQESEVRYRALFANCSGEHRCMLLDQRGLTDLQLAVFDETHFDQMSDPATSWAMTDHPTGTRVELPRYAVALAEFSLRR